MAPSDRDTSGEQWLDRPALAGLQRHKLAAMLAEVLASNPFYQDKFRGLRFDPERDPIQALPLTTRAELEQSQARHPPYGTNVTYPLHRYCRYHQTSGTGGHPMRWLDTAQSWAWFGRCWKIIFDAAGVGPGDRLLFPFSFGPFVGFWAAFESAAALGYLSIPAGGMTTSARLRMMLDNAATIVCCTPTYALRMAEVAAQEGLDLAGSPVRALIVAGEAGGGIPETRRRIEAAWGARLFDHSGMTEMGAISFECSESPGGLHLIESECVAEVVDPQTLQPVPDGATGELILTNLGRWGSPLIRYRTGDQVRQTRGRCVCGRCFARLQGGILGRTDDMFTVRGNNVFPSAVEAVLRRFSEIAEFRATVFENGALTRILLEIEPAPGVPAADMPAAGGESGREDVARKELAERVGRTVREVLSFRAEVACVPPGTLPRFEMKARRFVRRPANEGAPAAGPPPPTGGDPPQACDPGSSK